MAKLAPIFNDAQLIDGIPANGAKLFTYVAGSSTKEATFTDEAGVTPQTNPIILDSRGEPAQPIWLTEGIAYKFVFTTPDDTDPPTSPIRTIDNITGINDTSIAVSQWVDSGLIPTYVSATQFTVPGDQTSRFQVNRRLKLLVTAGTVYGYISNAVYGALTTVTVVLDSGVLDTGLSDVQLGIITPINTSLPKIPDFVTTAMLQDDSVTLAKLADATFNNGSIINAQITVTPSANTYIIALKTRAGTDPSATDPVIVTFRNGTLTSGTIVTRTITSALSLTYPSGATGGQVSGSEATQQVLLIDNAGTVELAAVNNRDYTLQLEEYGVISTTAMTTGSDSVRTIYSTVARSNVAYRNLAYFTNTQATAGTWVTEPSLIQPYFTAPTASNVPIYFEGGVLSGTASPINTITIPAWAKRITIAVQTLSTNGTSVPIIQLGDSGGYETSGYVSGAGSFAGTSASSSFTTGFAVTDTIAAATELNFVATLIYLGGFTWLCTGVGHATATMRVFSGYKTLTSALTDIQFTTVGGANTFDLGTAVYFVE